MLTMTTTVCLKNVFLVPKFYESFRDSLYIWTYCQVCECLNLDHLDSVDKRGYNDADDPRNLFAAMYGGVYKRSEDPYEYRYLQKH